MQAATVILIDSLIHAHMPLYAPSRVIETSLANADNDELSKISGVT